MWTAELSLFHVRIRVYWTDCLWHDGKSTTNGIKVSRIIGFCVSLSLPKWLPESLPSPDGLWRVWGGAGGVVWWKSVMKHIYANLLWRVCVWRGWFPHVGIMFTLGLLLSPKPRRDARSQNKTPYAETTSKETRSIKVCRIEDDP